MTVWFSDDDRAAVAAALDAAVPGSVGLGAVDYVERLLTALDHDPPRIWAAAGAWADGLARDDGDWIELGAWERHAWSVRIGQWRELYARVASGAADDADRRVVFEHACEATYGDPAYGGNRASAGWTAVAFPEPLFPPRRGGPS